MASNDFCVSTTQAIKEILILSLYTSDSQVVTEVYCGLIDLIKDVSDDDAQCVTKCLAQFWRNKELHKSDALSKMMFELICNK